MQMLDRDLDEAEEQHQVAVRSHLLNVDRLLEIQKSRMNALDEDFRYHITTLLEEFRIERDQILEKHKVEKRELQIIVQRVETEEKNREQFDITEHQTRYETIKNREIEEASQMKKRLEDRIEEKRTTCKEKLQRYQTDTEGRTDEYKSNLITDGKNSKKVEKKLRQVDRMQASIKHWQLKTKQNKVECEERNQSLRTEKDHIAKHYQELKSKMNHFRSEHKKRLADLTQNARNCVIALTEKLTLAERILKTAELCRKYETEREKVLPFYLSRDVLTELDEGNLDFGSEDIKDAIRNELTDVGIDEITYLDNFFKRYNKVQLDYLAIEQERRCLEKENQQLRSIHKQFLDGVSVNEDVLAQANPLLVVNGKVNLNHVPVKHLDQKKVYVEAAHHTANISYR